jgi:hypothetical protein
VGVSYISEVLLWNKEQNILLKIIQEWASENQSSLFRFLFLSIHVPVPQTEQALFPLKLNAP